MQEKKIWRKCEKKQRCDVGSENFEHKVEAEMSCKVMTAVRFSSF